MSTPSKGAEVTKEQLLEYVKKAKAKIKSLEDKLEKASSQTHNDEGIISSLREEVEKRNADNVDLSQKVASLEGSLAEHAKAKEAVLASSRHEMDTLIAQHKAAFSALEEEHRVELANLASASAADDTSARLQELQEQLEKATMDLSNAAKVAKDVETEMEKENQKLSNQLAISKTAIEQLKGSNRALGVELDQLKAEAISASTSASATTGSAPTSEETSTEPLGDGASASKRNKKKAKKKNKGSRSNSIDTEGDTDEGTATSVADVTQPQEEVKDSGSHAVKVNEPESADECGTLTQALSASQEEVNKLNELVLARQKELEELQDKLIGFENLQTQAVKLQDTAEMLQSHSDSLKKELLEKCKAEDELKSHIASLESSMEISITEERKEKESISQSLKEISAKLAASEASENIVKVQLAELEERVEHEGKSTDSSDKLLREQTEMEQAMVNLKEKLQQAQDDADTLQEERELRLQREEDMSILIKNASILREQVDAAAAREEELLKNLSIAQEHSNAAVAREEELFANLGAAQERIKEFSIQMQSSTEARSTNEQSNDPPEVEVEKSENVANDDDVTNHQEEREEMLATLSDVRANAEAREKELLSSVGCLEDHIATLKSQLEEARAKLQSVAEEFSVTHVQSQIDDAVSRAASMHTRALADLQEKLDAVVGEKATLQAAAERAGEELRAERDHSEKTEEEMTSKLQDLESTNKKLFAKLKVVMKEVTDMKESSVKVTEEKEALQSSLKDTAYQLQSVRDESAFAQGESDSLRRRIAELEELAKTKTQKEKRLTDAVGALNTKINELTVVCNDAKARLQVAEKEADEAKTALEANMIQKDLQGNFEAEEKVAAAVSAAKNMREKAEHYKNLCETLKKEKEGSDAKVDVLVDKIKRMKSLLTNAKSQKQKEREEKERKDSKSLNPEQRILSVLATISLPSGVEDDSPVQSWCLVLDDGDDDDDEDVVAEWVEEPIVRSWLDDGAKLSGEWPESLQDAWSREMNEIKSALEEEREAVNRELEETTKNFNTYKTRAQLAMKRMGQDDREERRAFLAEGECIQELNEEINHLKKRLEESSSARKDDMDKRRELVTKLKAALEQVQTLRGKLDKETQRATSLQETVDTLNAAKSNLVMASHTQSRERGGSGNMDTKGDSMNAEHHRSSSFNAPTPPAQADDPMSPAPGDDWESDFSVGDDGDDDDDDDGDEKDDDDDDDDSKHLKAGRENDDEEVEGEDGSEDGDQNASTGSYEVDDDEGYRILVYYRDENARLEKELTESTDEISSMKESLVELEHSLRREKEFNAPSNRVNAEYLVNVLRKFFLCDDENERSQLVVAVTQILHLLPDECKIITEKWAVKTKPRGWFG